MTAKELRQFLDYDPETGIFTRKKTLSNNTPKTVGGPDGDYWKISVCGRRVRAHRLAWLWMTGEWPKGVIDHRDGDGRNNCWSNLRDVSQRENMLNQKRRSTNKSGVMGVTWSKTEARWIAQIMAEGRNLRLGSFKSKADAIRVRKTAERRLGFHPNHDRVTV